MRQVSGSAVTGLCRLALRGARCPAARGFSLLSQLILSIGAAGDGHGQRRGTPPDPSAAGQRRRVPLSILLPPRAGLRGERRLRARTVPGGSRHPPCPGDGVWEGSQVRQSINRTAGMHGTVLAPPRRPHPTHPAPRQRRQPRPARTPASPSTTNTPGKADPVPRGAGTAPWQAAMPPHPRVCPGQAARPRSCQRGSGGWIRPRAAGAPRCPGGQCRGAAAPSRSQSCHHGHGMGRRRARERSGSGMTPRRDGQRAPCRH